jgi:hypothetical protein
MFANPRLGRELTWGLLLMGVAMGVDLPAMAQMTKPSGKAPLFDYAER